VTALIPQYGGREILDVSRRPRRGRLFTSGTADRSAWRIEDVEAAVGEGYNRAVDASLPVGSVELE